MHLFFDHDTPMLTQHDSSFLHSVLKLFTGFAIAAFID